jgi:hypothetical protein
VGIAVAKEINLENLGTQIAFWPDFLAKSTELAAVSAEIAIS